VVDAVLDDALDPLAIGVSGACGNCPGIETMREIWGNG